MLVTIYNMLPTIFNIAFDASYVSLLIVILCRQTYNDIIVPLKNEINEIKVNQRLLYESIIKLKNIINTDKKTNDENEEHIKSIAIEADKMYIEYGKRIDKIEEEVFKSETNTSEEFDEEITEEEEEEDDELEETIPFQNHVKFPHFTVYNNSNYQVPITNSSLSCNYLKDQIRLLSYELTQFLNVEPGTCMTVEEVCTTMMKYISSNCSRNAKTKVINMDSKLRHLFGIAENEDYELKSSNLILYLKPHLKVIV
jgi:hypothetical protein